jgi:predicted Zn-dependent protease
VLAHELGHLSQRHFVRKLADSKQNMWLTLAGFLTTIALASAGDSQGAIAVNAATQAAMIDRSLAYSRQFEQEADRLGMQTLVDAGLDPHAMPTFFTRMERSSRVAGSIPEFVLTHPLTTSRITDTYNRAKRYDVRLPQDSLDYQLARVRFMTAFMSGSSGGIARFQRQLAGQDARSDAARITRLGLALALLRDRQYDKAREALAPLLAEPTPRSDYVIAAAEIDLAERKYADAVARLAPALAIAPESYPLQMYHARAQIAAGHPEAVLARLEALARERPEDPQVWRALVDGYTASGNALGVYRARAEAYYLTGNDEKALEQLRIASETVKANYPLYAKLQKRMREMAPEDERGRKERN